MCGHTFFGYPVEASISVGSYLDERSNNIGDLSGSKAGDEKLTVVYSSGDDSVDPMEKTTKFNQDPSWRDEIYDFAETIVENRQLKKDPQMMHIVQWN